MKRCETCNLIFDDSHVFCTSCGSKLVEVETKNTTEKTKDKAPKTEETPNPTVSEQKKTGSKSKRISGKKVAIGIVAVLFACAVILVVKSLMGRTNEGEQVVYLQNGNLVYANIGKEPDIIVKDYAQELQADVITAEYYTYYGDYDTTMEETIVNNTVILSGDYLFYLVNFDWGERMDTIQADLMSCKLNTSSKKTKKIAHISFSTQDIAEDFSYVDESNMLDCRLVPYVVYPTEDGVKVFYSTEDAFFANDLKKETKLCEVFDEIIYVKDFDTLFGLNQDENVKIVGLKDCNIQNELEGDIIHLSGSEDKALTIWYEENDQLYYMINGQEFPTDMDYYAMEDSRFYADGKCYYIVPSEVTIAMSDYLKDSMVVEDANMAEPMSEDYRTRELDEESYAYYESYYMELLADMEADYDYWVEDSQVYYYECPYEDFYDFLNQESYYYDYYEYLSDYVWDNMKSIEDLDGFWDILREVCTYDTYDWDAYDEAYEKYDEKCDRDYIRQLVAAGEYDNTFYSYSLYYFDGSKSQLIQENVGYFLDSNETLCERNSVSTVVSLWDMDGLEILKENAMDIKDTDYDQLYSYQSVIYETLQQKIVTVSEGDLQELSFDYNAGEDTILVTQDHQTIVLMHQGETPKVYIYQVDSKDVEELTGYDMIFYDYSGVFWIQNADGTYDLYDGTNCIISGEFEVQQATRYDLAKGKELYLFYEDYGASRNALIYDKEQKATLYEIESLENFKALENGMMYYQKWNGSSDLGRRDLYYYMDQEEKGKIDIDVSGFTVDMNTRK